jgi:hypothetical protein
MIGKPKHPIHKRIAILEAGVLLIEAIIFLALIGVPIAGVKAALDKAPAIAVVNNNPSTF